jgi:hypothetical protein
MSYRRDPVWRLVLDQRQRPWEKSTSFCIEFFCAQGSPGFKCWLEVTHPSRFDDTLQDWLPAHIERIPGFYLYGSELIERIKKSGDKTEGLHYQMMDTLANGTDAPGLVHSIVWDLVFTADPLLTKDLREHASEWWESMTRDRKDLKDHAHSA